MSYFFPQDYIMSVYKVDFEKLYSKGYRVILFDIDNTLVEHDAAADKKAIKLFKELSKLGFKTALISNNREPRVKSFAQAVGADDYQFKASKPSPYAYGYQIETFGYKPSEALFFGDQVFTDVWGANLAGVRSVLVCPIAKWKEPLQIKIKRFLESIIMHFYKREIKGDLSL